MKRWKPRWRACLLAGLLAWLCGLTPAWSAESRTVILISDTHFGVGKENGGWHSYEDARWARDFAAFLQNVSAAYSDRVDLIMNGDIFELWQSMQSDCLSPGNLDLGCSEKESLQRLERVLAQHQDEMATLRVFADKGDNRLILVPGNHDAALLLESHQRAVQKAIGAQPNRVHIEKRGYWISADGLVYAEHGHQIGRDVNRFKNWPRPFLQEAGKLYLERSWGEQFVQQFYNQFEGRYPIIDNFSSEILGIKYGIAAEGLGNLLSDAKAFLRFYLFEVSARQFLASLGGDTEIPQWDVMAARQQGGRLLFESLPADDPLQGSHAALAKAAGDSLDYLSDDEISELCDFRYLRWKEQRQEGGDLCPQKTLGGISERLFAKRAKILRKHLQATREKLARNGEPSRFQVFVWSHTHLAEASSRPFSGTGEDWQPVVVNSGAWQRTAAPEQIEAIQRQRKLDNKEILKLKPEDLPPCYPLVLIEPSSSEPIPRVRYWSRKSGTWEVRRSCE